MPRISALPPLTGSLGSTDAFPFLKRTANLTERVDFNTFQSAIANAGTVQSLISASIGGLSGFFTPTIPASPTGTGLGLVGANNPALYAIGTKIIDWTISGATITGVLTTTHLDLPGAGQGSQITWNTSDIFLYRQGAGRLAIQMTPDGSGDQSLDIHNTYTTGQGSNRLRLFSYDANVQGNQHYLEIYVSRDIGLEGNFYNSTHAGAVAAVDHAWEFDGAVSMRLSATTKRLTVAQDTVGTDDAVNLTLKANATSRWSILQTNGTLFPFTDGNIDIGSPVRRVQNLFTTIIDSGTTGSLLFRTNNGAGVEASLANTGQIYPASPTAAAQVVAGIFAGNGLASNAKGNVGDSYFRGDGGLGSNIYKKFSGTAWPLGSWTPII